MKLIENGNLKILMSDIGKVLKAKDDNYEKEHTDENNNKVEEHIPYYFTKAYVPKYMIIKDTNELYDEILEKDMIKESESETNGSN